MGKARGSSFQAVEIGSAGAPGLRRGQRGCCVVIERGGGVILRWKVSKIQIIDLPVGHGRGFRLYSEQREAIMHLECDVLGFGEHRKARVEAG